MRPTWLTRLGSNPAATEAMTDQAPAPCLAGDSFPKLMHWIQLHFKLCHTIQPHAPGAHPVYPPIFLQALQSPWSVPQRDRAINKKKGERAKRHSPIQQEAQKKKMCWYVIKTLSFHNISHYNGTSYICKFKTGTYNFCP